MTQTLTDTDYTTRQQNARTAALTDAKAKLDAAGYTTALKDKNVLTVSRDGVKLGSLSFRSLYHEVTGLFRGTVDYDPTFYRRRRGGFAVDRDGRVNVTNVVARLRRDAKDLADARVAKAKSDAREQADAALLDTLVTADAKSLNFDTSATPGPGVKLRVWDGKVSIKADDLTPAQAQAVLAALGLTK